LSLSFYDFSQYISFLFLQVRDIVLKPDRLVFKLLQLLLEFVFDVEVIVLQFLLEISIFVEEVIKLIHFEIEIFLSNLELSNFFFVRLNLVIKSHLLLLKNRLLGPALFTITGKSHMHGLSLNKISLIRNPLFLDSNDLFFELLGLLENIILLGLHGS
jgi:hypothetical protein